MNKETREIQSGAIVAGTHAQKSSYENAQRNNTIPCPVKNLALVHRGYLEEVDQESHFNFRRKEQRWTCDVYDN